MQVDVILEGDVGPEAVASLGALAESYGMRAIWTSDYPSARDPMMALSILARQSSRIRLGALAVNPFELHPLKMASALFTLNEICHGRACILIGAGGGVSGTTGVKRERMVRTVEECIDIVRRSATQKVLTYRGKIYSIGYYQPSWVTQSPPLVYAAANKPQMLRMATRVADGIMVGDMTPQKLKEVLEIVDAGLAAGGRSRRDFRISNFWAWHVKEDRKAAFREARQQLALRGMLNDWYLKPFMNEDDLNQVRTHKRAFFKAFAEKSDVIPGVPDQIVNTLIENLTCTGSLDELDRHIERLREFKRIGLTEIALRLHDDPAQAIRVIGESVVPALQ